MKTKSVNFEEKVFERSRRKTESIKCEIKNKILKDDSIQVDDLENK
jgi:hypothetical protein